MTGGDNDRRLQGILTQTKGLTNAVLALIQPTDTSEVKLHKLYNVVMSKQNTDYPHVRKPAGMQKSSGRFADDSEGLLKQDRGNSYSLTLLFVAMARAAGFSAYPMRVASRGLGVFNPDVHNWAQLDSTVAIVSVDGRDVFFDPGTPFCPFGHLAPWHSNVVGVSIEGKLVKFRYTSKETYNTAHFDRTVNLKLAPEGTVSGTVKLAWTGTQGLRIRLSALLDDQAAIEKELQVSTQAFVPAGVQLQFVSFDGLSNGDAALIANFTLTGSLGTPTKTRLLLPQQFFESTSKPLLEGSSRTLPVNFPESFSERDLMTIELPAGYSVEAMPVPQSVALHTTDAFYKTASQLAAAKNSDDGSPTSPTVILQRVFVMSRIDYKAEEYAELREYLGKVETADREPLVLRIPSSQNAAK